MDGRCKRMVIKYASYRGTEDHGLEITLCRHKLPLPINSYDVTFTRTPSIVGYMIFIERQANKYNATKVETNQLFLVKNTETVTKCRY